MSRRRFRPVFRIQLLEAQHAVGDALHLQVVVRARHVVEQQHRAVAADEELLEREDLAAIAKRVAGEQAQLGERIEHDALRLQAVDVREDGLGRLGELHLGRVEHRVLVVRAQARLGGDELANVDAVERQPCDAATARSSASVSDSVTYRTGSPRRTPSSRNWRASVVLPEPGTPSTRNSRCWANPPHSTSSSPATPDGSGFDARRRRAMRFVVHIVDPRLS